jgi:hypothetical protein
MPGANAPATDYQGFLLVAKELRALAAGLK